MKRFPSPIFLVVLFAFAMCMSATTLAWFYLSEKQNWAMMRQFQSRSEHFVNLLDQRLMAIEHALRAAAGVLSQKPNISAPDWGRYIDALRLREVSNLGISGIGVYARVEEKDVDRFLAIRRHENPAYTIRPEGRRPVYFPMAMLRDINVPTNAALGFDGYTEAIRRAAIERAITTRDLVYTSIVPLMTIDPTTGVTTEDREPAVLAYAPAFRLGTEGKPGDNGRSVLGLVGVAVRLRELMAGLLDPGEALELELEIQGSRRALTDHLQATPAADALSIALPVHQGGRDWQLIVSALPAFGVGTRSVGMAQVFGLGSLIGMILASLIYLYRSQRSRTQTALEASEERFRLIAENVSDLITMVDTQGRRVYSSPSYLRLFGHDELKPGSDSFEQIHPGDRDGVLKVFNSTVSSAMGQRAQFRFRLKDGSVRFIESQGSVITDRNGKTQKIVIVSRDITERVSAEERLRHLAHHDLLTGLPNRALLLDRIEQALAQASRLGVNGALLYLDLDNFKDINDTLGHAAGDQLLREVAQIVSRSMRPTDSVARQGGDEFIILLQNLADASDAKLVAQKILAALSQPLMLGIHRIKITASIGISVFPQDGVDTELLLKSADIAMYHAKANGKNEVQMFAEQMNVALRQRFEVQKGLELALQRNELVLHYQPVVELTHGAILGVEALVRWQHPEQGLIGPMDFIPFAEESGLIIPLGEWVLRESCRQAKAWQQQGIYLRMAVNVSGRQFRQHNVLTSMAQVLDETALDAKWLEIELTESVLLEQVSHTVKAFGQLSAMGVQTSIDDFGTGYSSLSYLKRFGVDRLKIDRSFVRDVTTDRNDETIVRAILAMARGLEIEVTAEGVETPEQLAFLKKEGCTEAQGYLFSKPLPACELELILKNPPYPNIIRNELTQQRVLSQSFRVNE
ncbi:MAG: EAL domain-containing protein [Betaproteobacteria bacterium]